MFIFENAEFYVWQSHDRIGALTSHTKIFNFQIRHILMETVYPLRNSYMKEYCTFVEIKILKSQMLIKQAQDIKQESGTPMRRIMSGSH